MKNQPPKKSPQIVPMVLAAVLSSVLSLSIFIYFQKTKTPNSEAPKADEFENWAQKKVEQQKSRDTKDVDPYIKGPVKNSIIQNAKEIQSCYFDFLKSSKTEKQGKVKLQWQIDKNGQANKVSVVFNELGTELFSECLTHKVAKIGFPSPPYDQYYIEHTFLFKPEGPEVNEKPQSIIK